MKKTLKIIRLVLYHTVNGTYRKGPNPDMSNVHFSLHGDCTQLYGNCSRLSGDCSGLRGDCTMIWGDCTHICGYLNNCEATKAVHILELLR